MIIVRGLICSYSKF